MKADLIGVANDHTLLPVCGDRAVNDVITPVWMGSAVVGRAGTAVMDKAPEIIVEVVSPDEDERLKGGKRIPRDDDFNHGCGGFLAGSRLSGPFAGLSLKGGRIKARTKIGVCPARLTKIGPLTNTLANEAVVP